MSIRLRLTLLYTAILALTLIVFSTVLYVTQSELTLGDIRNRLARQSADFVNYAQHPPDRPDGIAPPPMNQSFLPGRWTQVRNVDGALAASTGDLSGVTLPLSAAALKAVQNGQGWFETADVENQPLLIYSAPLMVQGQDNRIVQVAAPIGEREQALNNLRAILAVGSLVVLLAAFAIGWALAGTALRPIERITHTAQAIGAERDFTKRVKHVGPNDEIGQLAATFNGMLTQLGLAYQQLQHALESQRRFVADASHELRTPLTTVRGNIELLEHQSSLPEQDRAEIMADTKDEVERLIRLVNQLLVLARSDAGQPLKREPIPLEPLVEEVCRGAKLRAPARALTCEVAPEAVALGDRDALKQVLVILVDNAVMHTPPNAAIQVSATVTPQTVETSVSDTGPGIAPNVLGHIFERFYRGDFSRTGISTGLGLAIAKDLMEAGQGKISVKSELGKGTVFTVTLPRGA